MSLAIKEFIERYNHQISCLEIVQELNSDSTDASNAKYRLISNGLMVQAYSIFELFLRKRLEEISKIWDANLISFSDLPEKIQLMAIPDSINALNFRHRILKNENPDNYLDELIEESKKIASSRNSNFEISKYFFGYSSSNITSENITTLSGNFGIKRLWDDQINSVFDNILSRSISPRTDFENCYSARNTAAHNPESNLPYNNLEKNIITLFRTGMAIDILITTAAYSILQEKTIIHRLTSIQII